MRITTTLILVVLVIAGIVCLQIFLSKREGRWPGLVLPVLAFLFGLLFPLNMIAPDEGITVSFIIQMLIVWFIGNIPTIILLAIYYGCRGKQRRNKQLDKMNIQDL